jgi:hypothetical protein
VPADDIDPASLRYIELTLQLRAEAFTDLSRNPVLDLSVRQMAMYERLKAKEAELAYNAAKGRILKKLARIKIVRNRSAPYEIEK